MFKSSDNSQTVNPLAKEQLRIVFANMVKTLLSQGFSPEELIEVCGHRDNQPKDMIPIEIFSTKLSPSESLCKYLKQTTSLSYKDVAKLINRDERSVWTSVNRANEKIAEPFDEQNFKSGLYVPLEIFANRSLSILENIIVYLHKNTDFTSYKIAKLLNKTPSMMYTIYKRAEKKVKKE